MSITPRAVGRLLSLGLLALAAIGAPSLAQTPGKSVKDQLVGHWQLVSITINGTMPYGDNPQGSMFIDAAGNYSVIVITDGKARSIAYFGTYTVDDADSSMTMHIQGNSRPNTDGRDQKRIVSFSGDEMVQTNPAPAGPRAAVKVTWKRAG
jgi:hypothetical protein